MKKQTFSSFNIYSLLFSSRQNTHTIALSKKTVWESPLPWTQSCSAALSVLANLIEWESTGRTTYQVVYTEWKLLTNWIWCVPHNQTEMLCILCSTYTHSLTHAHGHSFVSSFLFSFSCCRVYSCRSLQKLCWYVYNSKVYSVHMQTPHTHIPLRGKQNCFVCSRCRVY